MKIFYRPKKSDGITKPKLSPLISSNKKGSLTHDVILGSPAALLSHGKPNLRGMDVFKMYGPKASRNNKIINFAWFDLNDLIWEWK
uniref:Uncharacterized protein n=1 Tax=Kalanchoe fedtschenkoi TaxID=63787 RepID=A0A7N0TW03_KALFE